jgi:hypothetical protein
MTLPYHFTGGGMVFVSRDKALQRAGLATRLPAAIFALEGPKRVSGP